MRVTDVLAGKVEAALEELLDGFDYEVFARIQGPRESPEPVYVVGLFLPVSVADQIAVLSELDPYTSQERVTETVRALQNQALEIRDQNTAAIAPGVVRRGPRLSASGQLIVP